MDRHGQILDFIREVRESFVGAEIVYTAGSCYRFYKILKHVFPDAEAWDDQNHIITKIGDRFYDITGEVSQGRHLPANLIMRAEWYEAFCFDIGELICRF